jgi:alkyl hydroperoxide reductase subunit F
MTYDLAIIGGGPAGVAAGVYAARKRLKTVFITKEFGGQSNVSLDIQNWIGTLSISGEELAKNLESHLRANASDILDIRADELVQNISKEILSSQSQKMPKSKRGSESKDGGAFKITTDKGTYQAKTVLTTAGASRKKLEVPGAEEFDNKGLTYCASCDGPLFAGLDVAVVGGGNAALDTATQLLAYCKSVTILNRSDIFKADPATLEKVLTYPNVKILKSIEITEIKGDKFVTSISLRDNKTNKISEMAIRGVFVEIGSLPNTWFVKDLVKLDQWNRVIVDSKNQRSSSEGIWAAGDCTDGLFHQNNIAAGDAIKALEDIYLYIYKMK